MSSPTSAEVLTVARKAISIFSTHSLSCCLVGGAACLLYGADRTPNDVDLVIMTYSHGQEYLKSILANDPCGTFYLRPAKTPGATYKVLFASLATSSSPYYRYRRSCKVDILTPGIMNIPFVDAHRIVRIAFTPLMPFIPLLLLKLQAWDDHRKSTRYDFQAKQYVDVRDIEKLLVIAVKRKEKLNKEAEWLPQSFVQAAKDRVQQFVTLASPDSRDQWSQIGFSMTRTSRPTHTSRIGFVYRD